MTAFAGNKANPDAIELMPIPVPAGFASNMDAPVPFDAMTKVVVDCADAASVDRINRHFEEWYGAYAPTGAAAAWGTSVPSGTPQYETRFANLLRMVGHDMKVANYRDTGSVDHQIPPSWWIDN